MAGARRMAAKTRCILPRPLAANRLGYLRLRRRFPASGDAPAYRHAAGGAPGAGKAEFVQLLRAEELFS